MTSRVFLAAVGLGICLSAGAAAQQAAPLTVVQSGPTNEIQSLREANEIRIVFSEPMVALGRIPDPVTAPFVTIRPAIAGTFRWSGTTILIFTPGSVAQTAERDAVRRHGRHVRGRGERPASGRTVPFHVHDADRQIARPRLVSQEQALRQPDGARAAIQSAGSSRRRRAAHDRSQVRAARLRRPGAVRRCAGAPEDERSAGDPTLSGEGRRGDERGLRGERAEILGGRELGYGSGFKPSPDLVVLEVTDPVPPDSWVRVELDSSASRNRRPRGSRRARRAAASKPNRRSSSTASAAARNARRMNGIRFASRPDRSDLDSEIHLRPKHHETFAAADRERGEGTRTPGLGVRHAVDVLARGRRLRSPARQLEIRRSARPTT